MDENTVGNTVGNSRTRGLKPAWEPGQSGNPKGRPVGRKNGLRARLMQQLDKQSEPGIIAALEYQGIQLEDRDNAEVIAYAVVKEARKGKMEAVKIIAEQTELPHPKDINMNADFTVKIESKDADML